MHSESNQPSLPLSHLESNTLTNKRCTFRLSQFVTLRPLTFIRSTQNFHYFIELVDFIGSREEGTEGVEFCHDAAESEDVYWGVIVGGPQEEFWSSIPE